MEMPVIGMERGRMKECSQNVRMVVDTSWFGDVLDSTDAPQLGFWMEDKINVAI